MTNKKIVIIGGGASGIATTVDLLKAGFKDITLIESEHKLGGLAFAFEHEGKDFHTGYHQILESDKPILDLFKLFGLYNKISWKKTDNVIYFDGKIYDLLKIKDFLRFPMSTIAKIRFILFMLVCYTKKNWKDLESVSADAWIRKIAGQEVLEKLFAPLFDIKFGLKASEVSASWVGSRLGAKEASCRFGAISGKEWTTELFCAAKQYLEERGVKILLNTKAEEIVSKDGKITGVKTVAAFIEADIVVSTMSPIILNKLIQLNDPILDKITYIDSISTIISTNKTVQNVYWLMLMRPRQFSGGIFKLTDLNPTLGNNNEEILNFFTNVDHGSELLKMSDEELLDSYKKTYYEIYKEELSINWYKINRIPFVSAKYVKNYKNPDIRTKISGLYLSGNYMSYPSVTSTGTAAATGHATAKMIIEDNLSA
ncbi:MAG: amine oxidase [Burkholderiales bacterium]|jgi:protoporphyrinogen oxidase|nr:amine oxidase [Burkholderiales bacterium]